MKKNISILAVLALTLSACSGLLNVSNPNSQTTGDFGKTEADLREAVVACYNHARMEGTFSRVGYTLDLVRGDEVWNASQVWYLPYDDLNAGPGDEIASWVWRDWFYAINTCNYVIDRASQIDLSETAYNEIVGQALFFRGLGYYELATYFQTVPKFTEYSQYSSLETVFSGLAPQDEIFDLVEEDLSKAMQMLPSKSKGGEWASGRATSGAAAGYYARALMFRHKYSEALKVLEDIIGGVYGTYALTADFGDNFREGAQYENNVESLFEIQYMDSGKQGADEEWTPVNNSKNATNAHAVESNFAPRAVGGWADLSLTPWVYNLFKAERCPDGTLDARLYWTAATYEPEYDTYTGAVTASYPGGGDPRKNEAYTWKLNATNQNYIATNQANGGIPIAKWTNAREGNASTVVVGLRCGINLRLMRYSDVLLRAAECENEVNGPTTKALDWIDEVRNRAGLADLPTTGWTKDKLFEQIANVERPKEFAAENGRGIDLLRWGFFYSADRLAQIQQHNATVVGPKMTATADFEGNLYELDADGKPRLDDSGNPVPLTTAPIITDYPVTETVASLYEGAFKSPISFWMQGHEYFPLWTSYLNANPYLGSGNSANTNSDNAADWTSAYGSVHPVVALD